MNLSEYVFPILTFLSVIIGLSGQKSWLKENKGLRKLSLKGWFALSLGMVSFALTVNNIYLRRKSQEIFNAQLYAETKAASLQLISPFQSVYIRNHPELLKLINAVAEQVTKSREERYKQVPVDSLLTDQFIDLLSGYSIKNTTGVIVNGKRKAFIDVLADDTNNGLKDIEKVILYNNNFLSTTKVEDLKSIASDVFARSLITRRELLQDTTSIPDEVGATVLLSKEGTDPGYYSDNIRLYKEYMLKLKKVLEEQ